jgi:F0F1-type ATP synthase assembly protein I
MDGLTATLPRSVFVERKPSRWRGDPLALYIARAQEAPSASTVPARRRPTTLQSLGVASELAVSIVLTTISGVALGWWLDGLLVTQGVLMVAFGVGGLAIAVLSVGRLYRALLRRTTDDGGGVVRDAAN